MENCALDSKANNALFKYTTPSKRTFFPTSISACRRRSSIEAIESVGNVFNITDRYFCFYLLTNLIFRSKDKYRLKYSANLKNRQGNKKNPVQTRMLSDISEDEITDNDG